MLRWLDFLIILKTQIFMFNKFKFTHVTWMLSFSEETYTYEATFIIKFIHIL